MNCVSSFYSSKSNSSDRPAIVFFDGINSLSKTKRATSFKEFHEKTLKAQQYLLKNGFTKDDTILLMEMPSPNFFAFIIASLSLGIKILIIEPWLSLDKITKIIERTKPKGFMTALFGRVWGIRSKAVRNIPNWFNSSVLNSYSASKEPTIEQMDDQANAIITFTTGTTGTPKAVHRKHGYLLTQMQVLKKHFHYNRFTGPDLTIFTNIVLLNLVSGKTSLFVPPKWPKKSLRDLDKLPKNLRPQTTAVGPAFLEKLLNHSELNGLESLHVGGALCDNSVYERAIKKWEGKELIHVYGSSEAEPVALSNLEEAVQKSKDNNYFQTLYLGKTVEEITMNIEEKSAWISGIHVSPLYEGDSEEARKNKKIDEDGRLWHNMGDRISESVDGLWYKGRDFQELNDFELEQKIYNLTDHSRSFIHTVNDKKYLVGEDLPVKTIKQNHPEIDQVFSTKIIRDKRHRARIDRPSSLKGLI